MISCLKLEQPGAWRGVGIAAGFLFALAPALVLVFAAGSLPSDQPVAFIGGVFGAAIARSVAVAAVVAAFSIMIGLPIGLVAGLYDFPARRLLLALLALPLLVPSFILAIGLSLLRPALGLAVDGVLSGFSGTVVAFMLFGVPLVLFVTLAAVRGVSNTQVDAARLAGGEIFLFVGVARSVFPAAALSGALAGVLTLSDPGPGQILGHGGAASEILISFAAHYNFALAARQCLALAGVVFFLALPVALLLAPRLATGLLARDVTPVRPVRRGAMAIAGPLLLAGLVLVTLVLPLAGFAQPLLRSFPAARVAQEVARTLGPTVAYGIIASGLATVLGVGLAVCAGRSATLRVVLLAGLVLVLSLPPSLGALGWIYLAGASPAALDPFLRSPFTVGGALALRFFPIVTLLTLRSLGTTSPSWAGVAALHGVSLPAFAGRVLGPWLAPAIATAALLVVLLATADVGSVLLLHPPGESSLPLAIFTVMANAPEALVGALCLAYVGGAAVVLGLGLLVRASFPRQP